MIDIRSDIEKLLGKDEIVDHKFELKSNTVFTTNNRLIIKNGNSVRDILYSNISNVEVYRQSHWSVVIIGIVVILLVYYFWQINPINWPSSQPEGRLIAQGYGYIVELLQYSLGIALIAVGYLWKSPGIKLKISHPYDEIMLSGYNKKDIDDLFRLVNERRP